jgi:hypothetical protein
MPKSRTPNADLLLEQTKARPVEGHPRHLNVMTAPGLVAADAAIRLIGCGRNQFFGRVREGVYRRAQVRSTDPAPERMLFRLQELFHDEENRLRALQRG